MSLISPLIGAIAAGNCCVVKPSAYSPAVSAVIRTIVSECFPPEYVALVADPGAARNAHRVTASGDFGRMAIQLENRPMASNPKTSELTALSLVRLLANRVNPMVI